MKPKLDQPPTRLRAAIARGLAKGETPVEREGGDYGAGIIRGLAVVTRGEALGHGMWLDSDFVKSVAKAANEAKMGIKARFTHPGLSSDGMGRFLGRIKNARTDGDVTRGDLHFAKSAHETPDGNLAEYVMSLAEEDPEAFGTSIVFDSDVGAELAFAGENSDESGTFKSPDANNVNHLRHARLAKLYADDIVDEPAANPDGLFHRGDEIAKEADDLLSYALGLTEHKPELCLFDVNPDRVAGFVTRFMAQHGLEIKEKQMAENTPKPDEQKPAGPDLSNERLAALKSKYNDPGFVLEMLESGRSMAEAETEWLKRESAKKDARIAELESEVKQLKAAKPSAPAAGVKPAAFSGNEEPSDEGDFMTQARALAASRKIRIDQAMSQLAREKPALHAEFVQGSRK